MEAESEELLQSSGTVHDHIPSFSDANANGMAVFPGVIAIEIPDLPLEKRARYPAEQAKFPEKPAKHISPKCSPRRIQQPR